MPHHNPWPHRPRTGFQSSPWGAQAPLYILNLKRILWSDQVCPAYACIIILKLRYILQQMRILNDSSRTLNNFILPQECDLACRKLNSRELRGAVNITINLRLPQMKRKVMPHHNPWPHRPRTGFQSSPWGAQAPLYILNLKRILWSANASYRVLEELLRYQCGTFCALGRCRFGA